MSLRFLFEKKVDKTRHGKKLRNNRTQFEWIAVDVYLRVAVTRCHSAEFKFLALHHHHLTKVCLVSGSRVNSTLHLRIRICLAETCVDSYKINLRICRLRYGPNPMRLIRALIVTE
jgi:hypothetical protein